MSPLLVSFVIALADLDPPPADEDVKAGWIGFGLFLALLVVVGLLGWSLKRHLSKVERNREAGIFGDAPEPSAPADGADSTTRPSRQG